MRDMDLNVIEDGTMRYTTTIREPETHDPHGPHVNIEGRVRPPQGSELAKYEETFNKHVSVEQQDIQR